MKLIKIAMFMLSFVLSHQSEEFVSYTEDHFTNNILIDKILVDSLRKDEKKEGALANLLIFSSPIIFNSKIVNERIDDNDFYYKNSNIYFEESVGFLISYHSDYYTIRAFTEKYCFKRIKIEKSKLDIDNIDTLCIKKSEKCKDDYLFTPDDYFCFFFFENKKVNYFKSNVVEQFDYCDNKKLSKLRFERAKKIYTQLSELIDQLTIVDFPYNRYYYDFRKNNE